MANAGQIGSLRKTLQPTFFCFESYKEGLFISPLILLYGCNLNCNLCEVIQYTLNRLPEIYQSSRNRCHLYIGDPGVIYALCSNPPPSSWNYSQRNIFRVTQICSNVKNERTNIPISFWKRNQNVLVLFSM